MPAFKIILTGLGGVLDVRVVATEEEIKAAALDLVAGLGSLDVGDTITVVEAESDGDE